MRIEKPIEADSPPMADSPDRREELILRLHTKEVALLLDIFEAALPTEKISGLHSHNPALTHFFNSVYGGLITTARDHGWGGP